MTGQPAARIWHEGHAYVPESELEDAISKMIDAEDDGADRRERRDAYYVALSDCADRYEAWVDVDFLRDGIDERLPLEKLNRWLGFIQGTAISEGHTTVEEERDWSRALFRPLDFPQ